MLWEIALLSIFLYPTSGLLYIALIALFVAILLGFPEVERRKHSPWNPSTWWGWCTQQGRRIVLPSNTLWLSCLLSKVPNRLRELFYPLTLLQFNFKRGTKQVRKDYSTFQRFYGLARHAKYQTGQKKHFWHFTIEPFYLAPSDNHRHGLIIPLVWGLIYMPCCLIFDLHGGICFKTFRDWGGVPTDGWSCQDDFVRLGLLRWG